MWSRSTRSSFPHARGDGPVWSHRTQCPPGFSPRPWGWSEIAVLNPKRLRVFPTPVGMVRDILRRSRGGASFPHARGDGPPCFCLCANNQGFSPRPWGWSAPLYCLRQRRCVFPTPVGMVPENETREWVSLSFPHARGDGPLCAKILDLVIRFSPRPWGWSAIGERGETVRAVFPTPVGMVPTPPYRLRSRNGFPHARGDGPSPWLRCHTRRPFSPRPWGWSDPFYINAGGSYVFPTPVGMVPPIEARLPSRSRFPHARGDGPLSAPDCSLLVLFSPRPWGWSVAQAQAQAASNVFPTPVGMVRSDRRCDMVMCGFPHARGDGPKQTTILHHFIRFSPRPWGWSQSSCGCDV